MNQNIINVLVRQKLGSLYIYIYIYAYIYILYMLFLHMYTRAFLLCLVKAWESTLKKEEMEKLENKNKWNGSTEYEIEKVKQTR